MTVVALLASAPGNTLADDADLVIGDWGDGETTRPADTTTVMNLPVPAALASVYAEKDRRREAAEAAAEPPISKAERDWARTFSALAEAQTLPPDQMTRVAVHLADLPFAYEALTTRSEVDRNVLIAQRQSDIAASQVAIERAIQAVMGSVIERYWLGRNGLLAELPAASIPQVAVLFSVESIELVHDGGQQAAAYHLYNNATGLRTNQLISAGFEGAAWSKSGSSNRQRIAILELNTVPMMPCPNDNYPSPNHIAFKDNAVLGSRFATVPEFYKIYNCQNGCSLTTLTGGDTHGQWVTGVAAQDIMDGQDPNYTTYTTKMQRSGIAQEAAIYYYNIGCTKAGLASALQQATADNVDVINMSFSFDVCSSIANGSGVNSMLKAALLAGIVPLSSTGNMAGTINDACEIGWPASRPEVLAIGGLETTVQDADYSTTNLGWDPNAPSISFGGMLIRTYSGVYEYAAALDLVAPGWLRRMAINTSSYRSADLGGSSLASPSVAGSVALMRQALASNGYLIHAYNGPILLTTTLLTGDGSAGDYGSVGYGFPKSKVSRFSGFGRVMTWWPSSTRLTAPWAYHAQTYPVTNQSFTIIDISGGYPMDASITELKWAVTWFDDNLDNLNDIDIQVWNMCAPGGLPELVAYQNDYDFRNRVRLTAADIGGKCLELWIYGYSVSGTVNVTSAYMYHSGASL